MIILKNIELLDIHPFLQDYQKKSKNREEIPDYAELIGIFRGEEMIGYFAVINYENGIEINQGYLKPEARHKNMSRIAMKLLEDLVKKQNKSLIMLSTNRAVGSYQKFMASMGYSLSKAIFTKELV